VATGKRGLNYHHQRQQHAQGHAAYIINDSSELQCGWALLLTVA